MQADRIEACLTAMNVAEQTLLDAGDLAAVVHVSLAIDNFRAMHGLPDRALIENQPVPHLRVANDDRSPIRAPAIPSLARSPEPGIGRPMPRR